MTGKYRDSIPKKSCNIPIWAQGYEAEWLGFVSDDGVGLPPGFDINAIGTLGLRLVKILTKDSVARKLIGHQQRRGNL